MIDPTRHQQIREQELACLGEEILSSARNELYLNMRFLDISLSSLMYQMDNGIAIGTNGAVLYYHPEYLFSLYKSGRVTVNRAYLHMIFHCLFCHMDVGNKELSHKGLGELLWNSKLNYWNLACDIAVESMMDDLYQVSTYRKVSVFRRELYQRLRQSMSVLTAQGIYKWLVQEIGSEEEYARLAVEFLVDDHQYWQKDTPKAQAMQRKQQWDKNRETMETEMEMGKEGGQEDRSSLFDAIKVENQERYDYQEFLRKFSVFKEELGVDVDSFDYVFYTYGLSMYGNMPLVEPLETKEVYKIEEFVIVIDTSMSCSGELVKLFLEETYGVLSESESYFRKINLHIIQCDDQIREDRLITCQEEMKEYMEQFCILGLGGTDFRPAFEYVNGLMASGAFKKLKGLLYFTDGEGIYPLKKPLYDTAFIFMKDQYCDLSVPAWAMKLILSPEDLEEKKHEY